jgi:hypothetical protein
VPLTDIRKVWSIRIDVLLLIFFPYHYNPNFLVINSTRIKQKIPLVINHINREHEPPAIGPILFMLWSMGKKCDARDFPALVRKSRRPSGSSTKRLSRGILPTSGTISSLTTTLHITTADFEISSTRSIPRKKRNSTLRLLVPLLVTSHSRSGPRERRVGICNIAMKICRNMSFIAD